MSSRGAANSQARMRSRCAAFICVRYRSLWALPGRHRMWLRAVVPVLCLAVALAACTDPRFTVSESPSDEKLYTSLFPYYAEFCALSELIKKPSHGTDIPSGGPGGHSVLYLNGVCRVADAGYPTVAMCPAGGSM